MTPMLLCEDSRSKEAGYPFVDLVWACVLDEPGLDVVGRRPRSGELRAFPANGSRNVMRRVRDIEWRNRCGAPIIALLDRDRVRELTGSQGLACKAATVDALRACVPDPDGVRFVLLERNLESILEAIREIDPGLVSGDDFRRAIDQKELLARDLVFRAAADREDVRRELRMGTANASFAYLVRKVLACIRPVRPAASARPGRAAGDGEAARVKGRGAPRPRTPASSRRRKR